MKNHQVCIPAKAQVVLASVLFVISICDMGIMYDNVMAAQENKKDGYVTNCSGFGILATDRIYENQVFDIGETIRITYEITENAEVDYRLDVSNANGIDASVAVNDSDTNVTKGFFVDFSVEQEGVGEITVDLYSNNSENEKIGRVNIYTYTENGLVFVDGASSLYAEERYYGYLLEIGDIDLEEYEEKIEDMYRITDEDAIVEMEVTTSNVRAMSGNITVSGVIKWTDTAGVTHPANEIRVEIMDEDVASDDLIKAVYTDSNGKYTATFANDTSLTEGGYDIFVRVYARGRYVQVTNKSGGLYNFSREVCSDANGGTSYSVNFTLGNTNNAYRSIQVQQAVSMASNYVYQQEGSYLDTVYVRYPDDTVDMTCYYSSKNEIHVLPGHYCSWDVLMHEYGHHVSNKQGFHVSPGGTHYIDKNMADQYGNKQNGINLAWNEGWATYFSIGLQNKLGASSLAIPTVGDTIYEDTINSGANHNIETCNYKLGEANECTVSSVLFDIADGGSGESWDSVYMGYNAVYNLVVDNKVTTLDSFIALIQGQSNRKDVNIGKILSTLNVSSKVLSPSNGAQLTTTPPVMTWYAGGGSTKYPNNSFTIVFYNSSYGMIAQASGIKSTSYTLPAALWQVVRNASTSNNLIYWTVKSSQSSTPATGPYFSNSGYFYIP